MATEIGRVLYGDDRGHWAVLTWPVGFVSPPTIGMHQPLVGPVELIYLGDPGNVVCLIHNRHGGRKRPVQKVLADLLGVTQQAVSRYANGQSVPPPRTWPTLVRLWYYPRAIEDALTKEYGQDPTELVP